ncbi:MAG: thioesterase family protein [Bacteroidota bacterium]
MKNSFSIGATQTYRTEVTQEKLARFDAGLVHPVYATFALGKDVEWACRLFVLDMKEAGEEGVGSYLSIQHLAPAPLGSQVEITATLEAVRGNRVTCSFIAIANGLRIAEGQQEQRIVNQKKFTEQIQSIQLK